MPNIAEFIKARMRIEALAGQIALSTERKIVQDAQQHLAEANELLETLKTWVANEVQVIVVNRLTRQLTALGVKVESMAARKPARKKQQKSV